jgi:hypothetical protein
MQFSAAATERLPKHGGTLRARGAIDGVSRRAILGGWPGRRRRIRGFFGSLRTSAVIALAVTGSLVAPAAASATPSGSLDQSTITSCCNNGYYTAVEQSQWLGAQFVPGSSGPLNGLIISVDRQESGCEEKGGTGATGVTGPTGECSAALGDLDVSLWSTNTDGTPATQLAATTVSKGSVPSNNTTATIEVDFSSPPQVTAGQPLDLLLTTPSGSGGNFYRWHIYDDPSSQVQLLAHGIPTWTVSSSTPYFGEGSPPPGYYAYGFSDYITERPTIHEEFKNWVVSGSLDVKKLNQPIPLPEGSRFNGTASIHLETQSGPLSGTISVPPFNAPIKILGLPATVGLEITQVGMIEGSIEASTSVPGDFSLSVPTKANIGFSSITIFGLKIPTKCVTSEPLAFNLLDTLSLEELLSVGASFTGTTKFPSVKCEGALGTLESVVLTALFSGPNNPYSITISPPA